MTAGIRGKGRQFKPGQSGNPSGRPKGHPEVGALARQYTKEAIEILADIMRTGKEDGDRCKAAGMLLDRGWGKPSQTLTVNDMPDDELKARVKALLEASPD